VPAPPRVRALSTDAAGQGGAAAAPPAPRQRLFARFEELFQQSSKASAARQVAPPQAAPSSSQPQLSEPVTFGQPAHCLVLLADSLPEEQRPLLEALREQAEKAQNLAPQFNSKWPALQQAGCAPQWVWALGESDPRVHLVFDDERHLHTALHVMPALVRCGADAHCLKAWTRSEPCGKPRHLLPELLQVTCKPRDSLPAHLGDLPQLLQDTLHTMGVECQCPPWFSSKHNPAGARAQQAQQLVFNVLPRVTAVEPLLELVHRVSGAHTFLGGSMHMHGPNSPALRRCSECNVLGHARERCPLFGGLAVRLLFKQAFGVLDLRRVQSMLGGSHAYFGSSAHGLQPSRVVTVLLRMDSGEEAALAQLEQPMERFLAKYASFLQEAPRMVDTRQRRNECAQCGSTDKQHACPFPNGRLPQLVKRHQQPQHPQQQQQQHDKMCCAWRVRKQCGREQRCSFEHPADWLPPPDNCCRDFYCLGECKRQRCRFPHVSQQEERQRVLAAAAGPQEVEPVQAADAAGAHVLEDGEVLSDASTPALAPHNADEQLPASSEDDGWQVAPAARRRARSTATQQRAVHTPRRQRSPAAAPRSAAPGSARSKRKAASNSKPQQQEEHKHQAAPMYTHSPVPTSSLASLSLGGGSHKVARSLFGQLAAASLGHTKPPGPATGGLDLVARSPQPSPTKRHRAATAAERASTLDLDST